MAIQIVDSAPAQVSERPHISHSQVSMFDKCMLSWYLRYILKVRKPASVQMMVGAVVHAVLAANFRQKVDTGADISADEAVSAFNGDFDKRLRNGSCKLIAGQFPDAFKSAGAALLSHYLQVMAPSLMPMVVKMPNEMGDLVDTPMVEMQFIREIPDTGVDFVGVLDLRDNSGTVIDYKVVGKKWGKADEEKKRQATAYGFLLDEEITGEFHVGIRDAANPQIQKVRAPVSRLSIDAYVGHLWTVVETMKLIANGEMEPRVHSGFCSEMLCQHYFECQDWKMGILETNPDPGNWARAKANSVDEAA